MKKSELIISLFMALVMMAMSPQKVWADNEPTSFMVMSDMHVMSKNLFDDGTAFTSYVQTEPKLVENSQDVFDAAIVKIKTAKPKFVLIPGDLTKDGEKVSHEYVAAKLKELVALGIRVYVVPGNHDIGNPNAKSYLGSTASAVTSLTADEWKSADFYQSCGYADAVETSGLSYMTYPADGIALIALDSRKPDTETTHYSEGGLTEATLAWAETAAAKASSEGRVVIGMMHHPVVEHFDGHKDIGPSYLANQAEGYPALADVQQRLVAAGIGTMFTGHFHLQSIQYEETTAGKLYDVMTGSLSSYPMAMRSGTIATDGKITVASITDVASSELIAKALLRNKITTQGVFAVLANKMVTKIAALKATNQSYAAMLSGVPSSQSEIMALLNENMRESYEVLMNSLALGDENQDDSNTKIANCTTAYNNFLAALFANTSDPFKSMYPILMSQYTAQNTAMVTSVFQNTKGTGDVVADNTNNSLKTIPLPTIDAATWKEVLAEINDARVEYSDTYTITFANSYSGSDEGTSVGTGIKLYGGEDSDYNYIVAPVKAGNAIMAPEDCSNLFAGLTNLTSVSFDNFNTSNVGNMQYMFNGCTNLTALTIGNFDMSNVKSKVNMFTGCTKLNTLTMKSLPYLVDGTFNTQFSGKDKTVNVELDDNSVVYIPTANYLPAVTTAPTYTRQMSHEWGTLVLPFAVTYDADNGSYKLYQLSEADIAETAGTLTFTQYDDGAVIAAGTPMVIRAVGTQDDETGKYTVTLTAGTTTTLSTTITPTKAVDGLQMKGTYSQLTNQTDIYYIAQDQFWWASEPIIIAPFRAWFEGTAPASGASFRIVTDDVDGIALVRSEELGVSSSFDLQGHQIGQCHKGLQIRDGRVIMVK